MIISKYNFQDLDLNQKKYVADLLLKQYRIVLKRRQFFRSDKANDYANADSRLAYYEELAEKLQALLEVFCPKSTKFKDLTGKYN